MHHVLIETDKRSQDMGTSLGKFIDEQHDIRVIVQELARRIDAMKDGTHPRDVSSSSQCEQDLPDASVAMQLEIADLKRKVARLTDQSSAHSAH